MVPNDWCERVIEDVLSTLIDYRGKTPKKVDSGIPLITAKVIKNGRILPTQEYVAEKDYDSWMRRGLPSTGDVLITTEAPLGEVAQIKNSKIALAQRVILLRGNADLVTNKYLKYALMSPIVQARLNARSSGSTVSGIKQKELRKVLLPIPPLEEQKRIAHVLGTLDDKIELNRQMNETLEAIAQAIFKSWFIDFDGHDNLVESELGLIPEGWEVSTIGQVAKINPESYSPKNDANLPVDYIDISSVSIGTLGKLTSFNSLSEAPSRARRKVRHGDTIWSQVRPNRRSYLYVQKPSPKWVASTGFAVLRPEQVPSCYLYLYVTQDSFVEFLTQNATGSAYPAVKAATFKRAPILVPPQSQMLEYQAITAKLFEKVELNNQQSKTLTELRDTLLPKLISGELRVPEALDIAEETLDSTESTTPQLNLL